MSAGSLDLRIVLTTETAFASGFVEFACGLSVGGFDVPVVGFSGSAELSLFGLASLPSPAEVAP